MASPLLVSEAEVSPALATGPLHAPPQVGYPLGTEKEYKATITALDNTVGLTLVRALHLNTSGGGDRGLVFFYPPPKGEPPMVAQVPELLQRIPILIAKK